MRAPPNQSSVVHYCMHVTTACGAHLGLPQLHDCTGYTLIICLHRQVANPSMMPSVNNR